MVIDERTESERQKQLRIDKKKAAGSRKAKTAGGVNAAASNQNGLSAPSSQQANKKGAPFHLHEQRHVGSLRGCCVDEQYSPIILLPGFVFFPAVRKDDKKLHHISCHVVSSSSWCACVKKEIGFHCLPPCVR